MSARKPAFKGQAKELMQGIVRLKEKQKWSQRSEMWLSHQDSVGNFCKSGGSVCWVEPSERRVGARPGGRGERVLQGYSMRARSEERGPALCLLFQ